MTPVFHVEDDTVYALPFRSLAHVMRAEELPDANVVAHPQSLSRYVAAMEDPSRPSLSARWEGADKLEVTGTVPPDHVVAVQVSNDAGWAATQDGRELEIEEDRLGFMVLYPSAAAATHIELRYRGSFEQKGMASVSVLAWVLAIAALFSSRVARLFQ
jgi:hypothetical protein